MTRRYRPVDLQQELTVSAKADLLQGTLDILILQTLTSMGRQHGYGIARRIEQVSEHALSLNQGTVYPALLRLEQRGWISSEWGTSENNRRARFYSVTRRGRNELVRATESWQRTARTMARFLEPQPAKPNA
jgi:PadR family transcriptional regulator